MLVVLRNVNSVTRNAKFGGMLILWQMECHYVMLCHDSTVKLTDEEGRYCLAIEATLDSNSGGREGVLCRWEHKGWQYWTKPMAGDSESTETSSPASPTCPSSVSIDATEKCQRAGLAGVPRLALTQQCYRVGRPGSVLAVEQDRGCPGVLIEIS